MIFDFDNLPPEEEAKLFWWWWGRAPGGNYIFNQNLSQGAPTASDWANWTGLESASSNYIISGGFWLSTAMCNLTATEGFAWFTSGADSTGSEIKAYTRTGDNIAWSSDAATAVAQVTGILDKPKAVRLSDTRAVVAQHDGAADNYVVHLVARSGDDYTILDSEVFGADASSSTGENYSVAVLDETKIVLAYGKSNLLSYAVIATISADAFTLGTELEVGEVSGTIGLDAFDASTFAVASRGRVHLCTVSGTTITEQDTQFMSDNPTYQMSANLGIHAGISLQTIDSEHALMVYGQNAIGFYYAVVTRSGNSLTVGASTLLRTINSGNVNTTEWNQNNISKLSDTEVGYLLFDKNDVSLDYIVFEIDTAADTASIIASEEVVPDGEAYIYNAVAQVFPATNGVYVSYNFGGDINPDPLVQQLKVIRGTSS